MFICSVTFEYYKFREFRLIFISQIFHFQINHEVLYLWTSVRIVYDVRILVFPPEQPQKKSESLNFRII